MKIAIYDFLVSRDSRCTLQVRNILLRYAEAWSMKKIGYVKSFFGGVRGWDFVAFLFDEMMIDDVIMIHVHAVRRKATVTCAVPPRSIHPARFRQSPWQIIAYSPTTQIAHATLPWTIFSVEKARGQTRDFKVVRR